MGMIESMAKEMAREIGSKTREFYEFVLPPIDIVVRDEEVIVTADMPGFDKNNMGVTLRGRMLHIQACKERGEWLRMTGGDENVVIGGGGGDDNDDAQQSDGGKAAKGQDPHGSGNREEVVCAQRPGFIDKKVKLPSIVAYGRPKGADGSGSGQRQQQQPTAKYENGILSVSIPVKKRGGIDIAIQ